MFTHISDFDSECNYEYDYEYDYVNLKLRASKEQANLKLRASRKNLVYLTPWNRSIRARKSTSTDARNGTGHTRDAAPRNPQRRSTGSQAAGYTTRRYSPTNKKKTARRQPGRGCRERLLSKQLDCGQQRTANNRRSKT